MRRIWEFVRRPPKIIQSIVYIAAIFCSAASLLLVFKEQADCTAAFAVFTAAMIALSYSVYLLICFLPHYNEQILILLGRHTFTQSFMQDYGFRARITSILSLAVNIGYAVFEGILAIITMSVWYGALSGYYAVLSVLRFFVLERFRKASKESSMDGQYQIAMWKTYRSCGAALMLLSFAMSAAIAQMVLSDRHMEYTGVMIYAAAAYTFYKISVSIFNIVKARRYQNAYLQSLKNINFADALLSLTSLQAAMISTFSAGDELKPLNVLTGGIACILMIGIAVLMMINASKKIHLSETENIE